MTNERQNLFQIACLVLLSLQIMSVNADEILQFQIAEPPVATNVPRLGINLGEAAAWGAAQYPLNVLHNPGFEATIDRAIVIVKSADAHSFLDDTTWLARPDSFWAGATFDIRSGVHAGTQGVVFDSLAVGQQGLPEFRVQGQMPVLEQGNVVSLTRIRDDGLPQHWWFSKDPAVGQITVDDQDKRPNSSGKRALAIKPLRTKPGEVRS